VSEVAGIRISRLGPVAEIVLANSRRRNAITYQMWCDLAIQMNALAEDDSVRLAVLRGDGVKAFSAGADISEFAQWRSEPDKIATYNEATLRAMDALEHFPKPTVAAIQGFCIGGGLELALVCDIRLCSDDAQFAITPARLGLGYDLHDTELLVRRLGVDATREILFTARRYDSIEAQRLGIVSRYAPAKNFDELLQEYTSHIAANAPLTIKASKTIVNEALKPRSEQNTALCDELVRACYASDDYKEGRAAFAEKRQPVFTGK